MIDSFKVAQETSILMLELLRGLMPCFVFGACICLLFTLFHSQGNFSWFGFFYLIPLIIRPRFSFITIAMNIVLVNSLQHQNKHEDNKPHTSVTEIRIWTWDMRTMSWRTMTSGIEPSCVDVQFENCAFEFRKLSPYRLYTADVSKREISSPWISLTSVVKFAACSSN